VLPCVPAHLPFVPGLPVSLTTTDDDGTNPVLRFVGDVGRPEVRIAGEGYTWAYGCTDLKHRSCRVALRGLDGSAVAAFNISPDDPLYLYSTAGQTVGQVVAAILQAPSNAIRLNGYGIGAYTSMTPPTLPALTLSELAALSVVPNQPIQLSGSDILNTLEEFIGYWHPQYAMWVEPTGRIRVQSIFNFPARTLTVPTAAGLGDPIEWPQYTGPDTSNCFTAFEFTGLDIQTARLSTHDGTLSPAWSTANQNAWTILDFTQPRKGADEGSVSGVTSTSCTVGSDHATVTWPANYWNGPDVQGWIYLFDPAGTGLGIFEERQVTACSALGAGGSATITWDSGLPLNGTGYTRYRLIGTATPLALVGREYHVREPSSGALDKNTLVGSGLVPRNPKGAKAANNSRVFDVFYPYAFVQWSRTGAWPWFEVPVNVQPNPKTGRVVLTQPAVVKSAELAGTTSLLTGKYPTTFAEGLYYDLQCYVPYNRGALNARAPATGYSGTAYTKWGLQRIRSIPLDSLTWIGDLPGVVQMAQQHLEVVRDAVIEGSTNYQGIPTSFDAMALPYALTFVTPGATTPLDGEVLPVRTVLVRWPNDGALTHTVGFSFSNLKRPFQGDSLYLHPAFGANTFGTEGDVFVAGVVGGVAGMTDMEEFAQGASQATPPVSAASPLSSAVPGDALSSAIPVGQAPVGQAPVGQAPVGQDLGSTPLAAATSGNPIAENLAGAGTPDLSGFDDPMAGFRPGQPNRRNPADRPRRSRDPMPPVRTAAEGLDPGRPINVDPTLRERRGIREPDDTESGG
jgi:hypothetical protein